MDCSKKCTRLFNVGTREEFELYCLCDLKQIYCIVNIKNYLLIKHYMRITLNLREYI